MFTTSPDGRKLIRGIEKLGTSVYYDQKGIATVGYGHAIVMNGAQVNKNIIGAVNAAAQASKYMQAKFGKQIITEAEAEALFSEDMREYEAAVNTVCDDKTYQCEFDAMVSYAFNCGSSAFKNGSVARYHKQGARKIGDISVSSLCAWSKVKANVKTPGNQQQAFAAYSYTGGNWALGLYRRRLSELLVYSGRKADDAITTAWAFHD